MPHFALSTFVAIAIISPYVYAQNSSAPAPTATPTPLAEKRFDYNNLPEKADTDIGVRGPQIGYNRCNSTTEGPQSKCQTAIVNALDDFCFWAPPEPNSIIGNTEGEEVAWCTKPGYGTRLIPAGALQGVQFMKTPDYIQVVGFIDQTQINVVANDTGGELDPHGADLRGNPLGGLVYSKAWSSSFTQVIEWHNFMGGNIFCIKACDPAGPNAAHFCEHIFDRIGCMYNAPNNAKNGTFESCQGDNQDYPGIYTDSAGQVQTYTQPPESLGAISTMPYQPKVPASSNCATFTSSAIYTGLPTNSATILPSGSPVRSSGTRTSSDIGASNTGNPSGAKGNYGSPTSLAISSITSLVGVALAIFFLS